MSRSPTRPDVSGRKVGVEASHISLRQHRSIECRMGTNDRPASLVATDGLVENLRTIKDSWEVGRLRDGAGRLSDVAKCILPKALAGMRERDVAAAIEAELRRVGFEQPAFDTIVAVRTERGASAPPEWRTAGSRRATWSCWTLAACSTAMHGPVADDRAVGRAADRARRLMEQVAEAQQAAFEAVSVGPAGHRGGRGRAGKCWHRHGLGEAFTHGTGHGLGLEVHEAPTGDAVSAGPSGGAAGSGHGFHARARRLPSGLGWRANRRRRAGDRGWRRMADRRSPR